MINSITLERLVEYGIQAPSGHNTQPWLFSLKEGEIRIYPDFDRAMPVVDSDHHELFISLGCAAENIAIAATSMGLRPRITVMRSKEDRDYISVALKRDSTIEVDELVDAIKIRQTRRNKYEDKEVPQEELQALENSFDFRGVEVLTFVGKREMKEIKPFILSASSKQFEDRKFIEELLQWTRFSDQNAKLEGDGLRAKCLGLPSMPSFVGTTLMKHLISAKSEARRWSQLIDASAGLMLFAVTHNNITHWVRLGRAFQRFALTATKLGISHAHVNMPCEEPKIREALAYRLNLVGLTPLMLIRFGYSDTMPYSERRDVEEVIEKA
ncbi:Acg family FMN-binding oxidoreductase [Fodinibius halophilus]|uniref:Nitroreductase n=1 Tax=Fodinibius halophilus TaxID=1736908 RepID=A0A6M1T6H8_9BACT|nr:hypothetical protein [Fodinibius halophilus]NGP89727.1 hypothetical protein [Fodinibius halophilus]